jgi:LPS export ABC transporter protein LptC
VSEIRQVLRASTLAGLGALCWGAVGCADRGSTPPQSRVVADSADQILEQMTTTIVGNGVRKSLVYADTAFIYSERQVASLRNLRATFFDAQGNQTSVLTSKRGEYHIARGTLEARDSVVVVSMDGTGKRLRSQHLIYDRDQNQVRSDSAFTFESPTEVLSGKSFVSDPGFKNIVTRQPRGRQKGQGMLLPGQ